MSSPLLAPPDPVGPPADPLPVSGGVRDACPARAREQCAQGDGEPIFFIVLRGSRRSERMRDRWLSFGRARSKRSASARAPAMCRLAKKPRRFAAPRLRVEAPRETDGRTRRAGGGPAPSPPCARAVSSVVEHVNLERQRRGMRRDSGAAAGSCGAGRAGGLDRATVRRSRGAVVERLALQRALSRAGLGHGGPLARQAECRWGVRDCRVATGIGEGARCPSDSVVRDGAPCCTYEAVPTTTARRERPTCERLAIASARPARRPRAPSRARVSAVVVTPMPSAVSVARLAVARSHILPHGPEQRSL